jgi:hypothetical protein
MRFADRLVAIGALIACVCVPAAHAEERKHSWETGFFGGYTFRGAELDLDDGTQYGLRVGWYLSPPYEIEFQYLRGDSSTLNKGESTLISGPVIFFDNPSRTYSPTSYAFRFLINPRNERRRLKPYMQFGLGWLDWASSPTLTAAQTGDTQAYLFSVGGGVRFRLGAYTQFRAEMEDQYAISEVYSNFNVNVGLSWVFGGGRPTDTDGDGVLDLKDRCPDTPKGALVDKHDGCPWDIDGDGVMEGIDQCASTPAGWPVDEKGCPLDTDGDAVPDGADACADTPKGAIVGADGCPADSDKDTIFDGIDHCPGTPVGALVDPIDSPTAGCPHDTDNDGIFDGIDQCALTPAGALVDDKGCPQDSDDDRVLDGIDQCPDTPRGQKIDKEGCPRVRLDKPEAQILQNVKFHGMELYPGTESWLALLTDAATYWPEVKFEVGIYTDNEGGVATNRAAAQRRAEVLKGWLLQQGVPASHFEMKAYGPVNFIADNTTEEGREKNRRVEVKRLSGDIRKHPKPEPAPEAPPQPQEKPQPPKPDTAAPQPPPTPPATAPEAPPATPPATPPTTPPDTPPPPDQPPPGQPPPGQPSPDQPPPDTKPPTEPQPEQPSPGGTLY